MVLQGHGHLIVETTCDGAPFWKIQIPSLTWLRICVVNAAIGVLKRVVLTVPTFILVSSLVHSTLAELWTTIWPGYVIGAEWPFGKPHTWPFGVELLCLGILHVVLFVIAIAGDALGLAVL